MSSDERNQAIYSLVKRDLAEATKGRYSKLLFDDVSRGCIDQTVCIERVCLAIKSEKPRDFHHDLSGLGHIHYLVPGLKSLAINMLNETKKLNPKYIKDSKHISEFESSLPEGSLEQIADIAGALYNERSDSGRLTGEWIITAKHKENTYYLCLAKHDDTNIRERILSSCTTEFPFLSETLSLE